MTTSFQQADTGDQPEGAVTHYSVLWGDTEVSSRLQPGGMFGELIVRRAGGKAHESHAALIPVCHHSINGIATVPPSVVVDGVRYIPAPPEES